MWLTVHVTLVACFDLLEVSFTDRMASLITGISEDERAVILYSVGFVTSEFSPLNS